MAKTQVISVDIKPVQDPVLYFEIDTPFPGYSTDHYSITITGRIVANAALDIQINTEGRLINKAVTEQLREGCANFSEAVGRGTLGYDAPPTCVHFRASVGIIGITRNTPLQVRAVTRDDHAITLAKIVVEHERLPLGATSGIRPVLLTSLARTGTTWTMHLLSNHPAIVTCLQHPYESRIGQHMAQLFKNISDPRDERQTGSTASSLSGWCPSTSSDPEHVRNWFSETYIERSADFIRSIVEEVYIKEACLQRKPDNVTYFLEKADAGNPSRRLLWEIFPDAREIFLVRDPRAMLCSILSFNEKRQYQAFGRENAESVDHYIIQIRDMLKTFLHQWEKYRDEVFLLKYEDLILDSSQSLEQVLHYLHLDASLPVVSSLLSAAKKDSALMQSHRTSVSPEQSIMRWKTDLTPRNRALCNEAFQSFLQEFNYL